MSIGETLRKARLQHGVSVLQVSEETKIQPWVLESLESDNLHGRMGLIYVRGFLAAYARYLKLSADPLLDQLPPLIEEEEVEAMQSSSGAPQPQPALLSFKMSTHWIRPAVLVLACFLVVVILKPTRWVERFSFPNIKMPQLASISWWASSSSAQAPTLDALNLEDSLPLELTLRAKRTTWIQLWADDKLLVHQRLLRGAEERWRARGKFKLVVAKPTQVQLSLNGMEITSALMGSQGRVMITHKGIEAWPEESSAPR